MKCERLCYEDVVILKLTGEFEEVHLPGFTPRLDAMIHGGDRRFVLDLVGLTVLKDAALEYLIRTSRRLQQLGGGMVIARPRPYVRHMLEVLGREEELSVVHGVQDGIRHFGREIQIVQDVPMPSEADGRSFSVPVLFRKEDGTTRPPNLVGRIVTLHEGSVLFAYEPWFVSGRDAVDDDLVVGTRLRMKFRDPHDRNAPHVEAAGTVTKVQRLGAPGDENAVTTVLVRCESTRE
jgi:anti-anti-sigma factor